MTPTDCPVGTFSNILGLAAASGCQYPPYGTYMDTAGLTTTSAAIQCPELFKCYNPDLTTPTLTTQVACVESDTCPLGTILPQTCPPGTYNNIQTVASPSLICTSCPTNKFCPSWGLTYHDMQLAIYNCPDGYICRGSAIHPSNMDGITILLCPAGSYCNQNNLPAGNTDPTITTQKPCPVNYFNPVEG